MEKLQLIANSIILIFTALGLICEFIEKSGKIKYNPISKLLGIYGIKEEVKNIDMKVNDLSKTINNNEIDRIKYEILSFANMIKNDYIPDQTEFKHIHEIYDKYISLGGNSYIKTKMKYIEKMEELLLK